MGVTVKGEEDWSKSRAGRYVIIIPPRTQTSTKRTWDDQKASRTSSERPTHVQFMQGSSIFGKITDQKNPENLPKFVLYIHMANCWRHREFHMTSLLLLSFFHFWGIFIKCCYPQFSVAISKSLHYNRTNSRQSFTPI